jgi:hypothetical protein
MASEEIISLSLLNSYPALPLDKRNSNVLYINYNKSLSKQREQRKSSGVLLKKVRKTLVFRGRECYDSNRNDVDESGALS